MALFITGICWTRDKSGSLKLIVHKDRPGYVPAATNEVAAIAVGEHDNGLLNIRFVPPNEAVDAQPVADALLEALVKEDGEVDGAKAYRALVEGGNTVTDAAMKLLIEAGLVEREKQGRSHRYSVTTEGYAHLGMDAPHEQGELM